MSNNLNASTGTLTYLRSRKVKIINMKEVATKRVAKWDREIEYLDKMIALTEEKTNGERDE